MLFVCQKPKTVVVVDPDTATLEALCRILDELRFTAVAFVSSVEAKVRRERSRAEGV